MHDSALMMKSCYRVCFSIFCSVDIDSSESFLHGGELPTLIVLSTGHALHLFLNGQLSGR